MSRPKDLTHTNEASRLAAIRAAEILIDIEAVNFRRNNPLQIKRLLLLSFRSLGNHPQCAGRKPIYLQCYI